MLLWLLIIHYYSIRFESTYTLSDMRNASFLTHRLQLRKWACWSVRPADKSQWSSSVYSGLGLGRNHGLVLSGCILWQDFCVCWLIGWRRISQLLCMCRLIVRDHLWFQWQVVLTREETWNERPAVHSLLKGHCYWLCLAHPGTFFILVHSFSILVTRCFIP